MAKASPFEEAQQLQKMMVTYAKQETVDPLKTLAKYVGLGIAGAVMIFMGALFLGMGTLRFLQSEVSSFEGGGWGSLVPYLGGLGTLLVLILLTLFGFLRAKKALS